MISESELVSLCIANNRHGQHTLYAKYADAMYNICCRMITSTAEAEEVLQDAFITIFDKIQSFGYQSTLGAWIKRIVINKCIDHLRLKKLEWIELTDSQHAIIDEYDEPVTINISIIDDAIALLPQGYKAVFTLYAIEGYDHEEIAQVLSISEQTSKSQYHRAKEKLKEIIKTSGRMNHLYN